MLSLYANQLTTIKDIHLGFTGGNLRELNLGNNELTDLPDELASLAPTLKVLWLDDNLLKTLPKSILELGSLSALRLSRNALEVLPAQIRQLRSLEVLALDSNQLEALPESVNDLPLLRTLNVRQNRLAALPDLGALAALQTLAASSNRLAAAPPGLECLQKLEHLYFNRNQCVLGHSPQTARVGAWALLF